MVDDTSYLRVMPQSDEQTIIRGTPACLWHGMQTRKEQCRNTNIGNDYNKASSTFTRKSVPLVEYTFVPDFVDRSPTCSPCFGFST
jgi:hypothetical protein